ncbi:phosphoglycerate mutase family protein [uncultured Tenacibaculum sp.]|uniref:SixA phosphatase family protein n=1 Tax=uncultured Tenacibaculum sp. TaxID=174713 RepID=UPI00262CB2F4|nr:phosphoglycerate mutase family protein [uncultured Tenacibaculum sp.]
MKYFKLFILLFAINACTPEKIEPTTYYLIRHAEKDRSNKENRNPDLNTKGLERAKKWAKVFQNVDFDMVYSTNYNRTKQTATPTARNNKLEVVMYDPSNMYTEDFQKATKGKTVLIVGHSNTTPQFVNKILEEEKYKDIDDLNNANLYVVTIINDVKNSSLLKVD